jgi:hypothetical protein
MESDGEHVDVSTFSDALIFGFDLAFCFEGVGGEIRLLSRQLGDPDPDPDRGRDRGPDG